ncbi:NADPH dehydrogenase NamA [Pseudobacillus wudalianchiensis]|uniref:NADPH dehydrogenase n=1 Tax=Pseudobacillus wudalianchiensis TaxID=1743143 RepID=A0A1B9B9D3_9BACI|nr:NADPH dehydrogenase NamA [Bacillus wudalianchiensis]OCA92682.1 NADPH dehydrogenase NamA [Bacillus wudalianchiensis]
MARKLFEPYTIKDVTLKNRIVMSPMCMYSAEEDGKVNDWHLVHYPGRAVGQVGLIIVEATAVTPEGRISENDLGIWSDDHTAGFKKLVSLVKAHDAKIGIQLAHAGRKSEVRGEILAPTALAFDETMKTPKEMTKAEIKQTIEAFAEGARRAKEAGFDVIELHGAHGYLINEFLSPLTNHREDEYGGSTENRLRFLQQIIQAVRSIWNGPLFVRVSANDYNENGLNADDYSEIAKQLKELGVDLIDVSSGAVVPAKISVFPGYQVKFAETIKHGANIPVGAVGMITSPSQAEEILRNERADLIFLGRELLRDPYWPRRAAIELKTEIKAPVQYERGW